jgi:hypothetical protein
MRTVEQLRCNIDDVGSPGDASLTLRMQIKHPSERTASIAFRGTSIVHTVQYSTNVEIESGCPI